jgi:hypothetical protein
MAKRCQVQEHMEVLDKAGRHLGWVARMEAGERFRLTGESPRFNTQCKVIPLSCVELRDGQLWVTKVEGDEPTRKLH